MTMKEITERLDELKDRDKLLMEHIRDQEKDISRLAGDIRSLYELLNRMITLHQNNLR